MPMATVITGEAAASIHIPTLAKALLKEIMNYSFVKVKSGAMDIIQLAKMNSLLGLILTYGIVYSPLLASESAHKLYAMLPVTHGISKGQWYLRKFIAKFRVMLSLLLMRSADAIALK